MALQLSSLGFDDGQPIPEKYSCDGANVSPPLQWRGTPDATKSIAIICDDPDAPGSTFTHWVLYDIPATTTRLREGEANAGKAGVNSFGAAAYGGPCPPPKDAAHHYVFNVYALDIVSLGRGGLSKRDVTAAMAGHVLAEGQLTGLYQRKNR
jgi:Raf kinase inhibitor-like YbhB/YbcL family protein